MEHDIHQKEALRSNSTGATLIKPDLPVHKHSGETLSPPHRRVTSSAGHQFLLHMDEALEENSSDSPPSLLLDQNLICIIYHKVHVLVETKNSALNSHVDVFVEPHLHTISLLEVTEDLIDGRVLIFCSFVLQVMLPKKP